MGKALACSPCPGSRGAHRHRASCGPGPYQHIEYTVFRCPGDGLGATRDFPTLPFLTPPHPRTKHMSPSPQQPRRKEGKCHPSLLSSHTFCCLFLSHVILMSQKAINMPRHVESTLGDGWESQGCGQCINDPGARARPLPGSEAPYTRPFPAHTRGGVGGCPVATGTNRS